MGNGEWGMGNGRISNGLLGMGNRNMEWGIFKIPSPPPPCFLGSHPTFCAGKTPKLLFPIQRKHLLRRPCAMQLLLDKSEDTISLLKAVDSIKKRLERDVKEVCCLLKIILEPLREEGVDLSLEKNAILNHNCKGIPHTSTCA